VTSPAQRGITQLLSVAWLVPISSTGRIARRVLGKPDGLKVSYITADHLLIPQHLVWRPQRAAIIEYMNAVRKIGHHLHFVLDPDRRTAQKM
jgi:hypothetical protein